jgi:hypothetical protein
MESKTITRMRDENMKNAIKAFAYIQYYDKEVDGEDECREYFQLNL